MSSKAQRVYLLIHTPTHMGYPVQLGFVPQKVWSNALFQKYLAEVQKTRESGYSITHLSKRDIERWGFFPPVGARVQVMEVEVPRQEWFDMWGLLQSPPEKEKEHAQQQQQPHPQNPPNPSSVKEMR